MRVAALRTDIGHLYLDDVENASQRNFSSEPVGQSRYLHKPTDAELTAILTKYGITLAILPLATLKAAVYPSATTVNVAPATIQALAGITGLAAGPKAAITADLQNAIAPSLVETGPALLSFVYGKLGKLAGAGFQPGSPNAATTARLGYAAGPAVAIVANDGSTPFTV